MSFIIIIIINSYINLHWKLLKLNANSYKESIQPAGRCLGNINVAQTQKTFITKPS